MEQPKNVVLDVTEEPVAVESEEERPEPAFEPASGPSQISLNFKNLDSYPQHLANLRS